MLAHSDGTWQQSDPLALHKWVDDCAQRYGADFRRACRYLKGWRDFTWVKSELSSITIMVAAATALERLFDVAGGEGDDRLVYEIAQLLPEIFEDDVCNPVLDHKPLLNDWDDDVRGEIVAAARQLADGMESALKRRADQTLVVSALRDTFGSRLPNRPDMVEILPAATAAVVAAKPATVPVPNVQRHTSG